jgi:ribosomal protein S27AE
VIFFGCGFLLVAILVFFLVTFRKCPACGRFFALQKTGNKKSHTEKIFGAQVEYQDEEEFRCEYCGYTEWIAVSHDG